MPHGPPPSPNPSTREGSTGARNGAGRLLQFGCLHTRGPPPDRPGAHSSLRQWTRGGGAMRGSQVLRRVLRWVVLLALDAAASAGALQLALWLRFDGRVPAPWREAAVPAMWLVAALHLACNGGARLHRWSFRLAGLPDGIRVASAALAGSAMFT